MLDRLICSFYITDMDDFINKFLKVVNRRHLIEALYHAYPNDHRLNAIRPPHTGT